MSQTPEPRQSDLQQTLEAAGLRRTRQRLAVYGHLLRNVPHHPTAEEVYLAVKAEIPRLSLATVYKVLDALVSGGLVAKIAGSDGSARYDARTEDHYHLRCLRTGAVEDLPTDFDPTLLEKLDPQLVDRLRQSGFQLTGYRLELVGFFEDAEGESAPTRP